MFKSGALLQVNYDRRLILDLNLDCIIFLISLLTPGLLEPNSSGSCEEGCLALVDKMDFSIAS